MSGADQPGAIAVVGMSGRFPGAPDLDAFWRNLRDGVESIVTFTDEELEAAGVSEELRAHPSYVRRGVKLDDIELFDAEFFGYTPREAELMDPQHRLFLECAWEAFENAGHDPDRIEGPVGVFAGVMMSTYLLYHLAPRRDVVESAGSLALRILNDKDFFASRVSYKLGLRGPSLAVQTACSSSLVALHLASTSLAGFETDMALVGGASVAVPQTAGYLYQEGGIFSRDGHCRAFDAEASGTVNGSGLGVVVLKRLEDARRDGDTIRAVLLSTAVNNDGSLKMGYTAPSLEGQAEVVAVAQELAGVDPRSVSYVEAHGTGTALGDPVEVSALTRVFREGTGETGFCALGSVKTNIGHLDAAAGIAGLIKTVLALEHRQIPQSLNFSRPSPEIDFDATPFRVATELREWTADGGRRRAGVSSLGVGGTNAHVVLEEAPTPTAGSASRPDQILVLSARRPESLELAAGRLADRLDALDREGGVGLADVAFTLQSGRKAFEHRRAAVCRGLAEGARALRAGASGGVVEGTAPEGGRRVVFLFPGQGSQHPHMGAELYRSESVFRREIDRCAEGLREHLEVDLRDLLYQGGEPGGDELLAQTAYTQPVLFAVEWALARLWRSWGVHPAAMAGHSIGEWVAACLAGVFPLEDALGLVALRGRLMQGLPPGAMLSVPLSAPEVEERLGDRLEVAAVNTPSLVTVAGPHDAVDEFAEELHRAGIEARRLRTSHAFHTRAMDPILEPFAEHVAKAGPRPPELPFLSGRTGTWISPEEATDPGYWAAQVRDPVQFSAMIQTILSGPEALLLELGPGSGLCRLARAHRTDGRVPAAVPSLPHPRRPEDDRTFAARALARVWCSGGEVDWSAYRAGEIRRRVPLPTYPFRRLRHWIEAPAPTGGVDVRPRAEPPGGETGPEHGAGGARPGPGSLPDAPRTPVERLFVEIWEDLLGVRPIGVHDDFFELGGSSFVATQALSRIRDALGRPLPVRDLFEAPTVASLAERLASQPEPAGDTGTEEAPPPTARWVPRDGPLSWAQEGIWAAERLTSGSPVYNLISALSVRGALHPRHLAGGLRDVVRRHEALRTTFPEAEGWPVQRIGPRAEAPLPLVDLRRLGPRLAEGEVHRWLDHEGRHAFDLATGPLLRTTLFRLSAEEWVFLLDVHHIVFDGLSLDLVVAEMAAAYRARLEQAPLRLPPLPTQYADFAVRQRRRLDGAGLEAELDHWRRALAGAPTVLELPADRPRPEAWTGHGDSVPVEIEPELGAELVALGREAGCTPFMTLFAGFLVLLHAATGREDLVVGAGVSTRTEPDLEGLVGLFVNNLAVRTDLAGDPAFRELLPRVRRTLSEAYAHRELPFELLLRRLEIPQEPGRSPLVQVLFSLLEPPPAPDVEDAGLRIEDFPVGRIRTKFDLELSLNREGDRFRGILVYARDLFDRSTVEGLVTTYVEILAAATADPDRAVGELSRELRELERRRAEESSRRVAAAGAEGLRRARRRRIGAGKPTV